MSSHWRTLTCWLGVFHTSSLSSSWLALLARSEYRLVIRSLQPPPALGFVAVVAEAGVPGAQGLGPVVAAADSRIPWEEGRDLVSAGMVVIVESQVVVGVEDGAPPRIRSRSSILSGSSWENSWQTMGWRLFRAQKRHLRR